MTRRIGEKLVRQKGSPEIGMAKRVDLLYESNVIFYTFIKIKEMRMRNFYIFVLAFLLSCLASTVFADGQDICDHKRPLNAAEKQIYRNTMKTIKKALPPPAKGWRIKEETNIDAEMPKETAKEFGCPQSYANYKVIYFNMQATTDSAQSYAASASMGDLMSLSEEMAAAAQRGDMQKAQELQEKMQEQMNQQQESGKAPVGAQIFEVTVNSGISNPPDDAKPFLLPGVDCAFISVSGFNKEIMMQLARNIQRTGDRCELFESGYEQRHKQTYSNFTPEAVEIRVSGHDAEKMAKAINFTTIRALFKAKP